MLVEQESLLDFLGKEDAHFFIPAYQRVYSWNEMQCEELWLDILRAGRSGRNHFLGTVLYACKDADIRGDADSCEGGEACKDAEGSAARFEIIDGQQRLTSISLIILALIKHVRSNPDSGIDAKELEDLYLYSGGNSANREIKFTPSHHDVEHYIAEVEGREPSAITAISRNLSFFESKMKEDDFNIEELVKGLSNLVIIAVEVEDLQMAQTIFEGINSKGMPLNVADMIRNYLLLAEGHDEQTRLYEEYWKPSQEMFSPDPGSLRLNSGIKSWISIRLRTARVLSSDQVYSAFKKYVEDVYQGDKEPILRELRGFCLMWAENYRYHGTKKYKSGSDWAELGAPALTANYKLKKADNEEYAERVRKQLRETDSRW